MGARDFSIDLPSGESIVAAIWAEHAAPPPRLSVTEWAEQRRNLSSKDSAEPGPYRCTRTPYAREPQDCLSAHSPVQEVILMWGAQTSKTTIGSNWLGYIADINPGPTMVVQPTIDLAKRYSSQRLAPMIEESPVLRRKIRENRSRDAANTTLLKEYPGGLWVLAGANSAAGLRSMPVRDLFLDEIDAYPFDVDGEGDPGALAEARQTTFSRRKRLKTSTPTTKDFSRIETEYLASDRCQFHVPCPHCGEHQVLEWGATTPHGIKWSKHPDGSPDPSTVHYICRHCGAQILEHHKPTMLAAGRWVATHPGAKAGKVRGFQLSSLYSPLGWLSWSDLVVEWHTAVVKSSQGDPSKLRAFVNTRLAETYEEDGDKANEHELRKRAPDIPLRQVHWGLFIVTAGVDVQGDRLEAYAWAWGRGMERQLVDRKVIHGDPGIPEGEPGSPWTELTAWRRTPIQHASGRVIPIMACFIDSGGHHTNAVYVYARTHKHMHVYAVKGQSLSGKAILGKPTDQDVSWRGTKIKKGIKLWLIGTDTAKAEIYGRLRKTDPGPGYVHISRHFGDEVFQQLTSERLATRYVKGHPRLEWVKPPGKRNEALDCAVYALAAAHFLGLERYRESDWARAELQAQGRDLFDAPAAQLLTTVMSPPQAAAEPTATDQAQGQGAAAPSTQPPAAPPPPPPAVLPTAQRQPLTPPKPTRPARKGWAKSW